MFGVYVGQKVGKDSIMCMKFLYTILAPYRLRSAMQMIHMLEGTLIVSFNQSCIYLAKLSL